MKAPACLFAAALLWAVVLALSGCDGDEGEPTCAVWLDCYDACSPWALPSVAAEEITRCDSECRAELDYDAARVAAPLEGPELLTLPSSAAIVAAELAAVEARDANDDRAYASALAVSVQERGNCKRSPREP